MTQKQKQLHDLMQRAKADENLCAHVYQLIEAAPKEEQLFLFEQFVLEYKYTPSDNTVRVPQVFPQSADVQRRKQTLKTVANVLLDTAKQKYSAPPRQNASVWQALTNTAMFQDETTRFLLLMCCAEHPQFPYQDCGETALSIPMWKQLEQIDPLLVVSVKHAINQTYENTAQEAAVYNRLLNQCKTDEEKSVLLGIILVSAKCQIMDSVLDET